MKIQLGYETVTAIDDGGITLSFRGEKPNFLIPPVLSFEVISPRVLIL